MVLAFQIIMLIIIAISFIGSVVDDVLRSHMTAICIASMLSFIISVLWL